MSDPRPTNPRPTTELDRLTLKLLLPHLRAVPPVDGTVAAVAPRACELRRGGPLAGAGGAR